MPPLGYDVVDRKLLVNDTEADLVRHIFKRFLQMGSATKLIRELARKGYRNKSWVTQQGRHRQGGPISKSALYRILTNRVYLDEAVHKGTAYLGEHAAIVDRRTWDRVQTVLAENRRTRGNRTRAQTPALLRGLIFAPTGHAMTPSHARKNGRLYRYYVRTEAIKNGYEEYLVRSIPAGEVEVVVLTQVRALLRSPEIIAQTWAAIRREGETEISERDVIEALGEFEPLWDELIPAEQTRIVRLLVDWVEVSSGGIDVRLRAEGLRALAEELRLKEAA